MKKTFDLAVRLVIFPFALALAYLHYLALLFTASIIIAAIAAWGFGVAFGLIYLSVAWKVYAALIAFNLAFLSTFAFQHCCIGMGSFISHLKHQGWAETVTYVFGALIWPLCWFNLGRNLGSWHSSLPNALFAAIEYWFVSSWRGVEYGHIDFQSGTVSTFRIRSSGHQAVIDAITEHTRKDP